MSVYYDVSDVSVWHEKSSYVGTVVAKDGSTGMLLVSVTASLPKAELGDSVVLGTICQTGCGQYKSPRVKWGFSRRGLYDRKVVVYRSGVEYGDAGNLVFAVSGHTADDPKLVGVGLISGMDGSGMIDVISLDKVKKFVESAKE